ncbi:hypothetical protein [Domibacillus mangrovi]|uniref:Uncharacterized protein n=1 Tax=Domibacillus mangrovi TaxID=1714354 RepID=A0A1Q5P4C4_9BACI|nr:hypothetical protein [Domibacillus mangrovi]OKL36991.1 hypothetical protein BLL40_05210 [Domibacillus mangrovi]
MTTQVTLKIKGEDGQVTKVQHEVEEINLFQFEEVMKSVKDIFTEVQGDEALKTMFSDLFDGTADAEDEEVKQRIDERFIQNAIGSFETLAVHMPTKAFKLLSVLSGIELKTLQQQKVNDVFDIYDAVVEENDLQKLFNRAKKSLAATKVKLAFMKKVKQVTESVSVKL